jgi:hypothetical protein
MAVAPDLSDMNKPADGKPPTPPGGKPADAKADAGSKADDMLAKAESSGALKPIQDWLDSEGQDDIDAKDVLKFAQKDDRTRGKPPEQVAKMLGEDPALLEDLMEARPGGMYDRMKGLGKDAGMKSPTAAPDDESAEGEAPTKPSTFSME